MKRRITIAIDGPAGSGKSTSARLVAKELGYTYLDTGAMYRAITLAMLERGLLNDPNGIQRALEEVRVRVEQSADGQRTLLNDKDVSERIRAADVTRAVSAISAIADVRTRLVRMQQELGEQGGIVMDGRDIGTVVFPNAELKIFLVASIETRAKRRLAEAGDHSSEKLPEMAQELERRDEIDSTRTLSPLLKAEDAVEIDTSELRIEDQVARILDLVRERLGQSEGIG